MCCILEVLMEYVRTWERFMYYWQFFAIVCYIQHAGKKMYFFTDFCTTYSHWQKRVAAMWIHFYRCPILIVYDCTTSTVCAAVRSKNVQFQSEWEDCRSNMLEILLPLSKYILAYYLHSLEVFETGITSKKKFYDIKISF